MESNLAIAVLGALAQDTRLKAFKVLVKREPGGVAVGELARLLKIPQNTLSTHLAILTQVGLASSKRHSRSIVYRAKLDCLREVVLYLLRDCCDGKPELCAQIISDLTLNYPSQECCP